MMDDKLPICRACPKCGNSAAKKVRSDRLFTFSGDRRCTRCTTLYTPPTPRWVAYLFLAVGGLLMIKTGFGVAAMFAPPVPPATEPNEMTLGGWVCLGLVTLFGLISLWQGLRVLREKQIEPPTHAPGQDR